MDTLQINTGEKRLMINGDADRVLVFNPSDALFAERFYALVQDFETTLEGYKQEAKALEQAKEVDESGMPLNIGERITLMKNICTYMRGKVDELFGAGTSKMVFGETMSLEAITQLFSGLTPYIQQARIPLVKKYIKEAKVNKPKRRRVTARTS